jgi:hypothetical protein
MLLFFAPFSFCAEQFLIKSFELFNRYTIYISRYFHHVEVKCTHYKLLVHCTTAFAIQDITGLKNNQNS